MFDVHEMEVNFGPQHPSTHGVLRVILKIDGERIIDAKPTEEAPWHDPDKTLDERMTLAAKGTLKDKLFAAMAQTDCTACGWDCEGYAAALASGESKDITLCVPGEAETESMLKKLMAGKV